MSDIRAVYLDNNASTPLYPEVVDAMLPYLTESYGNPSSGHGFGRSVKAAIAEARESIATAIGADPAEIYFTSGGTEADNIAIKGYAWANSKRGGRIVTSTIEHPAVLATCKYLSKNGFDITYVDVDDKAIIDPQAIANAIDDGLWARLYPGNPHDAKTGVRHRGPQFHHPLLYLHHQITRVQKRSKTPLRRVGHSLSYRVYGQGISRPHP